MLLSKLFSVLQTASRAIKVCTTRVEISHDRKVPHWQKQEKKCFIKMVNIKTRVVKHIKESSLANQQPEPARDIAAVGDLVSPLLKTLGPLMKEPPRSALHHCHIKSK